jgi:dihydroorotase
MNIKIINGTLICPTESSPKQGELWISSGKIIAPHHAADFKADLVIDATDKWIMPSAVDLKGRVHLPGVSIQYDNGIKELSAYQQTGFSQVTCFPNHFHCFDGTPTIDKLVQAANPIKLTPVGALTVNNLGEQLNDYQALHQAGCVAFSSGLKPITDLTILRSAYDLLASYGYLLIICPQEATLTKNGCAHEGKIATRLGLKSISRTAETVSLVQHLSLIEATGVRAHFTGLTSADSIDLIRHYKNKGLNITCDVAIAHLHLTEVDIGEFNALYHVNPPLRASQDLLALKKGLLEGVIDAIVSDHCPLNASHKLAPFEETLPGMSLIDSFLKLCLKTHQDLSLDQNISLNLWVAKFTLNPLTILGLPGGTLQPSNQANLLIVDPKLEHLQDQTGFHSQFKQSPFHQWPFSHEISHILSNGQVLYSQ